MLCAAVLTAAPGRAQGMAGRSPSESYLRVEWQPGQTRRGKPIVSGYVHNLYGEPIGNVRLSIEETDASGQVVATTVGYVDGVVPPKGSLYFETRVPRSTGQYRVVILYYDLFIDAGGR